ncbi:DUF6552 family protein [Antarctobacter sp.]|uniref:DUF6552 family protein n=1 Tax=Antarctobacter sp. TaxID=1872577 RepID=UPI002B27B98B|nr:DUF6552 family protein [Antarctobacter sp.]
MTPTAPRQAGAMIDTIKWGASIAQIGGYAATGFGFTTWALPFFAVGLLGWLAVGMAWRDRAIVLIHLVAMVAMLTGLATRG